MQLTTAEYIALYREWGYGAVKNRVEYDVLMARMRDYGIEHGRKVSVAHARRALTVMTIENKE